MYRILKRLSDGRRVIGGSQLRRDTLLVVYLSVPPLEAAGTGVAAVADSLR